MTIPRTTLDATGLYRREVWETRLRDKRRELGLSMREVAKRTGMNESAYWQIEHGGEPMLSSARAIAGLFGMTVEALWIRRKGPAELPARSDVADAQIEPEGPTKAAGRHLEPACLNRVATLCERYLTHRRSLIAMGMIAKDSRGNAEHYIRSFATHAGDVDPAALRNSHLTSWLADNPSWRSPHTMGGAVAVVVTCFRWLDEERLIDRVPFNRRTLRLPTPQPRQAMLESEYRQMMVVLRRDTTGHTKTRIALRCALYFLWQTGARTCEMRSMRWDQVDLDRGVVTMLEHKTDGTGLQRIIVLTPGVVRLFKLFRRRGRTDGLVFLNGRGRKWDRQGFARRFKRVARLADVRKGITAYCLRHGFCCRGLEAGVGERQIADLMGHGSTRFVAYYGRGVRTRTNYLRDTLDQVHANGLPRAGPVLDAPDEPDAVMLDTLKVLATAESPMSVNEIAIVLGVCKGTLLYRDRMRRLRNLGLVVHNGGHLITDKGRAAIGGGQSK